MTILLIKVQWMPFYGGEEDVRDRWGSYEGPPGERYNFARREDGNFYGYLRPPRGGENVNIANYFDQAEDGLATGTCIVFVAPEPFTRPRPLKVVGFYLDAEVYAGAINTPSDVPGVPNIRILSDSAVLIPEGSRDFEVDIRGGWRTGTYRAAPDEIEKSLANYVKDFLTSRVTQEKEIDKNPTGENVLEWVVISRAERRERRSSRSLRNMKLTGLTDYVCAGCDLKLKHDDHASKERMFEVHHTNPIALLAIDDVRDIDPIDLKVVCANCHRAIHTPGETRYVSDLAAFRRDVLKLESRS